MIQIQVCFCIPLLHFLVSLFPSCHCSVCQPAVHSAAGAHSQHEVRAGKGTVCVAKGRNQMIKGKPSSSICAGRRMN